MCYDEGVGGRGGEVLAGSDEQMCMCFVLSRRSRALGESSGGGTGARHWKPKQDAPRGEPFLPALWHQRANTRRTYFVCV